VLGIKRWFDELFDCYLVEEVLGFRVLIGKRKGLICGYKEEEKYRIFWCLGAVRTVPVNSTKRKRRESEKEHTKDNMPQCSKYTISFLINFISSLSSLSTSLYKDSFLY
jgi:hypothetical protein